MAEEKKEKEKIDEKKGKDPLTNKISTGNPGPEPDPDRDS